MKFLSVSTFLVAVCGLSILATIADACEAGEIEINTTSWPGGVETVTHECKPGGNKEPGATKSYSELEQDRQDLKCDANTQKAAIVHPRCVDVRDPVDCPQPEVKCVPASFGNDPSG